MGYYFTLYGCQGSCLDWTFTLTQDQRNDIKNLLGSYNARLFLTFGGPGEFWEDCIDSKYISNCVATTAAGVAQFAADNQFDGIELSLNLGGEGTTNSEYANDGSFRNSTQTTETPGQVKTFTFPQLLHITQSTQTYKTTSTT